MDYLKVLNRIMPPGLNNFVGFRNNQWEAVEKKLNIDLPMDYKCFINCYGAGGIDDFLWILTPFSSYESIDLITRGEVIRNAYRCSKEKFPSYYIHNIYPEKSGLLPWGYTDNGDELYWLTKGKSEDWNVVIYESRSSTFYEYDMGMLKFIFKLVSHDLKCLAFPEDTFIEKSKFINY